ncbi:MAG TPA: CDP-alcohol phosphatidyltransferase family protein [Acidimicrobiales bacterium]|nr:CDP-alcohol phosphatidyltransferase family protein [Acidimicrobiales bacterium]
MFDGRWRNGVDRTTSPIGQALHRHGITADVLTATGLISATATGVLVATGHLHWAVVMLIVTGMHDLLDGPVAKAAGTASVRGAFFDSVTDRVADAVIMLGASWYLLNQGEGHLALLPMAILAVTSLVSYERAKAESLGLEAKGGLMERGERMFVFGVGLLSTDIFVPVLWVLFILISFTAIARFVKVWNAASGRDAVIRRRLEAWREGRVDSRWRTWRESRESAHSAGRIRFEGLRTPRTRTTSGAPVGRWRARRQEALSSRSGRTMRERRRATRAHGNAGPGPTAGGTAGPGNSTWSGTTRRRTARRTTPPSAPGSSGASS